MSQNPDRPQWTRGPDERRSRGQQNHHTNYPRPSRYQLNPEFTTQKADGAGRTSPIDHQQTPQPSLTASLRLKGSGKSSHTIHTAASKGDLRSVLHLLRNDDRVQIDDLSADGQTALHFAAIAGHKEVVHALLERNAKIIARQDGQTALHCAASGNDPELVNLLLDYNANLDQAASRGITPLMIASSQGSIAVVQCLLGHRANAMAEDTTGEIALHYAAFNNRPDTAKLLGTTCAIVRHRNWRKQTPLILALERGHKAAALSILAATEALELRQGDVLDPDLAEWLTSKNLLSDSHRHGSGNTWEVRIPWNLHGSEKLFDADANFVEVPKILRSQETYNFLGFDTGKAADLWLDYQARSGSTNFIDVAHDYISRSRGTASNVPCDWAAHMTQVGVVPELRSAILNEDFEDIRLSANCDHWIKNAIASRWSILSLINTGLIDIGLRSVARAPTIIMRPVSMPEVSATSTIRLPTGLSSSSERRVDGGQDSGDTPSDPAISPTRTQVQILFRGAVRAVLDNYIDSTQGLLTQNMTSIPGDFSGQTRAAYFSDQRKVAERYAVYQWTLGINLAPFSRPAIMAVGVSRMFLDDLKTITLLHTDEKWREVVFRCRKGEWFSEAYEETGVDLVKGHVASGHDEDFASMTSSAQIPETMVLKIDGEYAMQWAFISEKSTIGLKKGTQYVVVEDVLFNKGQEGTVCMHLHVPGRSADDTLHKVRIDEIEYETKPGFPQMLFRSKQKAPDP